MITSVKIYTLEDILGHNRNIDKAIDLLLKLHGGQLDKSGYPYILHPLAVANHFNPGKRPIRYLAGLLHDVVEDNEDMPMDIIAQGFGGDIADIIWLLTRPRSYWASSLTYFQYIERIIHSGNKDAMAVKMADLKHNLNRPGPTPASLKERYKKARRMIGQALGG